ncbi:MAG TPA: 30S ribosomal protein S16 [Terriglobales bacterium]|nr:30S ribosomal protein S16 [Terriglobales bacterium]
MAVVIRLMRAGARKRPSYRLVAADSRRQRDGRFLEILGHYNPIAQPYELVIEKDRVQSWLDQGAQPSEQVASLLRANGMTLGKPSKPTKKKGEGAPAKARARSKPRPVSARKIKARAARKAAGKKSPSPAAK